MKLSLTNIGKIKEASVEIDGITLIAGENDTGKSAIGKALFSVFNSFYNINDQISKMRRASITAAVRTFGRNIDFMDPCLSGIDECLIESLLFPASEESAADRLQDDQSIENLITSLSESSKAYTDNEELSKHIAALKSRIQSVMSFSDDEILTKLLSDRLNKEFNSQVINIYSEEPAEIVLTIQKNPISIKIGKNGVEKLTGKLDLHTETVYLDDPFVLDGMFSQIIPSRQIEGHRAHLQTKLQKVRDETHIIEELLTGKKLNDILDKLSSVCEGNIEMADRFSPVNRIPGTDKTMEISNLSTGLKTFVILKQL